MEKGKTPGVDAEANDETQEMDDETPGVDADNNINIQDINIQGVDDEVNEMNDVPVATNAKDIESTGVNDELKTDDTDEDNGGTYQSMNLCRQKQKEYSVFNIDSMEECEGITMLQFANDTTMELDKSKFDIMDAE